MAEDLPQPSGEFLLYSGPDGRVKVECRIQDETLWLTQRLMADLIGVWVPAIKKYPKNIVESGVLVEAATISKMEMVRAGGHLRVRRKIEFYNPDAISALGYRSDDFNLQDATKTCAMEALLKAEAEFETFGKRQVLEYRSDFDEEIRRIQGD